MLIIPAIDLKEGLVVRYTKGRLNKKIYSHDPIGTALSWQAQGGKLLHVVDLDGAMTGRRLNFHIITRIVKSLKIPVEVSGGIRSLDAVRKIIGIGAQRVVLGTKAIEDIAFLRDAINGFGKKIGVGLDLSGASKIGLYGWKKSVTLGLEPLLEAFESAHLKTLIFTDIRRDGTLKGLDILNIRNMLGATGMDIIVSGGVSSLSDIRKLARLRYRNLKGVIIGKALYENKFSLRDALACCAK